MKHPDWAVKYRRPGTELRRITEKRYCLYECSSVYDKEKKRARKITGLQGVAQAGPRKRAGRGPSSSVLCSCPRPRIQGWRGQGIRPVPLYP